MVKLYRLIPDSVTTTCQNGCLSTINEDIFYELGYLNINQQNYDYFESINDDTYTNVITNGIYFFTSPWSCLFNLKYIKHPYSKEIGRIYEYEISDELFEILPKICEYYDDCKHEEIIIPIEILKNNNIIQNKLTTEMKNQLIYIINKQTKKSFTFIEDSIINNHNSPFTNQKKEIINGKLKKWYFNPIILKEINENRLENIGEYFKSNIITSKQTIITQNDYYALCNLYNYIKKEDVYRLRQLLNRSNDIFTFENLQEFLNKNNDKLKININTLNKKN